MSRTCAVEGCGAPTRPVVNLDMYVCDGEHVVTGQQLHNAKTKGERIVPGVLPPGAEIGRWYD